jgi:transposase-like protein
LINVGDLLFMIAIFINIFSWIIKLWLNYDEDLEHCLLTKDSQTSTSCCPKCGSYHTIKNGSTHNGKPKRQCKECGRQFVINPTNKTVSDETKQLIDKLLLERI